MNPRHAALTYDDGIHSENTPKLLEILRRKGVTATFFILGNSLYDHHNRQILKKMYRAGHNIASHGYDHTPLTYMGPDGVKEQLEQTSSLMNDIIGIRPRFVRAPEGYTSSLKRHR